MFHVLRCAPIRQLRGGGPVRGVGVFPGRGKLSASQARRACTTPFHRVWAFFSENDMGPSPRWGDPRLPGLVFFCGDGSLRACCPPPVVASLRDLPPVSFCPSARIWIAAIINTRRGTHVQPPRQSNSSTSRARPLSASGALQANGPNLLPVQKLSPGCPGTAV